MDLLHAFLLIMFEIIVNLPLLLYISLRVMPQALMKYDGLAVHCCLHDCNPLEADWKPQALSTMLKIVKR